jgi:glycosyltransferase involved in cell wall biosynthesis
VTSPLISCLMVTRNRARFAARALRCLAAQTWRPIELIVVDDGDEDYSTMLAAYRDAFPIRYLRDRPVPGRRLGGLRNMALDAARGELCAQWDDDEWYHPERLAVQARACLDGDVAASVLDWTLMHVDTPQMADLPYRADAGHGTPGTIVHRRTAVRYPNLARGEDDVFLESIGRRGRIARLGAEHSHLFIRCFHGGNTWDDGHFRRRLRRTPLAAAHYVWARLRGDLRRHPQLRLTPRERDAVARFLDESRELSLLRAA